MSRQRKWQLKFFSLAAMPLILVILGSLVPVFLLATAAAATDTTPPVVYWNFPGEVAGGNSPTIFGSASDNVGVTEAHLNLDGGPDIPCNVDGSGGPPEPGALSGIAEISCPTSGLADGEHTGVITAHDAAGNEGSDSGSFWLTADPFFPDVRYTGPYSFVSNDSPTVTGTARDNVGVTEAHLNLNGGPDIPCTLDNPGSTIVNISCPTSGLANGDYSALIWAYDASGNGAAASGSFTVYVYVPAPDTIPPVVTNVRPWGTITDDSPTISADFSDTGFSGYQIYSWSIRVLLDETALSGCTVNSNITFDNYSGDISCPTSGLASGEHHIEVSVTDGDGNVGSASGSFTVATATGTPDLALQRIKTYWASYADYQNHQLSVDMKVNNTGDGTAIGTTIIDATATNGVTVSTTLPLTVGDIASGGSHGFTLVYTIPVGVTSFKTTVFAQCQDESAEWYYYPGGSKN